MRAWAWTIDSLKEHLLMFGRTVRRAKSERCGQRRRRQSTLWTFGHDVRGRKLMLECLEHRRQLASSYAVTDLGTLPGYDSTTPMAINNSGQVVGFCSTIYSTDSAVHAFLYSDGVRYDLETLPNDVYSEATAINDSGEIVGWSEAADGTRHAFEYADGVMHELASFGGAESEAADINNSGQVVGWTRQLRQNTLSCIGTALCTTWERCPVTSQAKRPEVFVAHSRIESRRNPNGDPRPRVPFSSTESGHAL